MAKEYRILLALVVGAFLGALGFVALFSLQLGAPTENSRWYYEIYQKKKALAADRSHSAVVFIAGSNTLFGIDSKNLEAELGRPVINFGLGAAMGLKLLLDYGYESLQDGDTVVLPLEYELYSYETSNPDAELLDYVVSRDPAAYRALPLPTKLWFLFSIPTHRIREGLESRFFGRNTNRTTNLGYDSRTVDAYGSETINVGNAPILERRIGVHPAIFDRIAPNAEALAVIRKFVERCRSRSIEVFGSFPSLLYDPGYEKKPLRRVDDILDFYQGLGTKILGSARGICTTVSIFTILAII